MRGERNIQANPADEKDDENEELSHTNIAPCSPSSPSSTCRDEVSEEEHPGVRPAQDSKFKELAFRKKLKVRGRLKRADRQLHSVGIEER